MEDQSEAFSIRRYEQRDREAGAHLGNGEWDEDLRNIEAAYLEGGGEFLVGEMDGRLVAMGALKKIGADDAVGQIVARRLYEKNGCRETGRERIGPFECVSMEKGIGRSQG